MLIEYDATQEKCPLPLVKMRQILNKMQQGDSLQMLIKDPSSKQDIPKYLSDNGYQVVAHKVDQVILQLNINK